MPDVRTEITEIVTGLAMLGYQDVQRALEVRPRHIAHVDEAVFDTLESAHASGRYEREFATAWDNGVAFARSSLGLRGRPPWTLEWKGHHKPASKSIETIPADLRVDHVYLISCKYGSRILHNAGPVALFDNLLATSGPVARSDWFEVVAPDEFRAVWRPVFDRLGLPEAVSPSQTTQGQRDRVKAFLVAQPLDTGADAYVDFVRAVSSVTARRWQSRLGSRVARHEMYWRLLRMQSAPYFVLGARHDGTPLRYRVSTPWDFQRRFSVEALRVSPGERGQPSVDWSVDVVDTDEPGRVHTVAGHVEIRWSHGKLQGAPEAKVYLDTDPLQVPGYDPVE